MTFREPREGLTFGVNADGMVGARQTSQTFNVRPQLLRADARDGVLDVMALRLKLGDQIRSAEFAMQMIRMPEEQVIEWA